MKFLLAALVFILALSITTKSVANESMEVCTTEKHENCNAAKESHGTAHSKKDEEGEKLSERMNSFLPTKVKNSAQSERPGQVKLKTPKFLSKISGTSVKLEWESLPQASVYHVQVATDPNFKWLVANDMWVKTNSFEATQLESGKTYYWRVAAVKDSNDPMFTKSLFVNSIFETTK